MARIPVYERRIAPGGDLPVARATSNVSAQSPVADAIGGIGRQLGGMADTMMKEAVQQQENNAAVDVSNVLSQADVYWQEKTTEATKAWTVGGPDLRKTIGDDFDKWSAETEGKLATEKAKMYFKTHAAGMKSKLQTGVYSFQEKATTAKLNADSAAGEQADENVVFNDAGKFEEVYRRRMEPMLARTDLTESEKIRAADVYRRKLSLSVERGQLERDPATWYKERFGEFKKSPEAVAAGAPAVAFDAAGGGAISTASGDVPASLWAAQIGQESGGKQFSGKGTPLTSPKGAVGIAQVMPGTAPEAAKLAGLPFDERRYKQDAGYNEQLGQAYMAKQLQTFGGDQAKALAAYNAGPGRVTALVAKHGDNWLQYAPEETKGYVKNILAKAGQGGGVQTAAVATGTVSDAGSGMPAVRGAAPVADNAPSTFKGMDWEQQSALRSAAESRLKQDDSRLKAEADRVLRDAIAMHKDGIVDPVELKPEFFAATYGADGARMHAEYTRSRDMGSDIGGFKTQSQAEIMGEIQKDQPVPGAGYASADERQSVRIQAAQRILQAREADPAGYVVQTNESLRKQRQAIDNPQTPADQRPGMVQQYVRESMAEQQRLGIQAPRILTPGQSDAIAKRAMSAARPEDSANLIAGLEAEYGKDYFPKVFGELVRDKKISGELLLIPNLPSQTAREAVSRLARVKESDLTAGLKETDVSTAKEKVIARLAEFASAVPMMNGQATGVINSYETSMRKLSYSMMAGGMKPADAVEQANAMLLGHYQFDGTMRVPTSVRIGEVQRGAAHMIKTDMAGIDVPRDLVGARKPEELSAEWQDTVRSRPMWFTSDDDSGLTLYAQGANGVRYRVTRGGKPVTYSWPDLAGRVATGSGRVSSGKVTDLTGGK